MSVYGDGLAAFGNAQTVEIPPDLTVGGGIASTNDAVAKNPLGTLYRYKGNLYRYVKFDNGSGDVASAAYGVSHWKTLDPSAGTFTVTSDRTDALLNINGIAGIFGGVVTDGYYTWIQVGGLASVFVAAGTAVGDMQIGGATDLYFAHVDADGTLTSVLFGVALTAVSSNKSSVILRAAALANF